MSWAAKRRFSDVEPDLEFILQFLDENPEIHNLHASPFGLAATVGQTPSSPYEYEDPDVLKAIQTIDAKWVTVYEDQVHVVVGHMDHRGTHTAVAFTAPRVDNYDISRCSEINKQQRESEGVCGFPLSNRWLLTYEWHAN